MKDFLKSLSTKPGKGYYWLTLFSTNIDTDSAGDEYLKIISDKILPCTYIEGKKVEDIKNLLIDLLGKYTKHEVM